MIPGETIATGAPSKCPDCGDIPDLNIYRSQARAALRVIKADPKCCCATIAHAALRET